MRRVLSTVASQVYAQIVVYRRDGDRLRAYRVSGCPHPIWGHYMQHAVEVSFESLHRGHCQWIADDIDARQARQLDRSRNAHRAA